MIKSVFSKKKMPVKIIAGVITLGIIMLLILSGPASALTLGLAAFSNSAPMQGQSVSTVASLNINSNERLNLTEINLVLDSPVYARICKFKPDGTPISGCSGITITKVSDTTSYGWGYGYKYVDGNTSYGWGMNLGYTNGVIAFNITVDTTSFRSALYTVGLTTSLESHGFNSPTQTLNIREASNNDVKASDLVAQSRYLISGKNLTFGFNLQNTGLTTLTNVKWKLESGIAGVYKTGVISALEPGKGIIIMNKFIYPSAGTYTLKATADPDNLISEFNELNNEQTLAVSVG
jgi:hypothetical protein